MKKILVVVIILCACIVGCKKKVRVHDPISGASMVLTLPDSSIKDALHGGYKIELIAEKEAE